MKTFYLVLVALCATLGLNAQELRHKSTLSKEKIAQPVVLKQAPQATMVGTESASSSRKTASTGVYYSAPKGTLFWHWAENGYGSLFEINVVPPFDDFTFVNRSTNPTTSLWHMSNAWTGTWFDYSSYADSDGSLTSYIDAGYYMPAPTVVNAAQTDSFTLAEEWNYYNIRNPTYGYQTMIMPDSICGMGFTSDHGLDSTYYFGGGTSTGYLGGTLTLTSSGYIGYAVEQDYPAPASPLYVEDIYMMYIADSTTPLPDGTELTMYIYDINTEELLYTLTAAQEDIISTLGNGNISYTQTGYYEYGYIKFSQKVTDDFGNAVAEPFVIDTDIAIIIRGYDTDGVSIGVVCDGIMDGSIDDIDVFYILVYDPDTYESTGYFYRNSTLNLSFNAMFDKVLVADELSTTSGETIANCNVLRVSDDGTTCYIEGQEDLPGAYVMTAIDWYDSDGNENYYFNISEDDEWVEGWSVTDDVYSEAYALTFSCSPITSGGRSATLYVQGKGIESNVPLVVLQGDITIDDVDLSIEGIKAESKSTFNATAPKYNLGGARVDDSHRGLFIQDGRKFIGK